MTYEAVLVELHHHLRTLLHCQHNLLEQADAGGQAFEADALVVAVDFELGEKGDGRNYGGLVENASVPLTSRQPRRASVKRPLKCKLGLKVKYRLGSTTLRSEPSKTSE